MDNLTDSSWIWEERNNTTNLTLDHYNMCESVTNHWLYLIFTGYLIPLVSPRVREFIKDKIHTLRNCKVTGRLVS